MFLHTQISAFISYQSHLDAFLMISWIHACKVQNHRMVVNEVTYSDDKLNHTFLLPLSNTKQKKKIVEHNISSW